MLQDRLWLPLPWKWLSLAIFSYGLVFSSRVPQVKVQRSSSIHEGVFLQCRVAFPAPQTNRSPLALLPGRGGSIRMQWGAASGLGRVPTRLSGFRPFPSPAAEWFPSRAVAWRPSLHAERAGAWRSSSRCATAPTAARATGGTPDALVRLRRSDPLRDSRVEVRKIERRGLPCWTSRSPLRVPCRGGKVWVRNRSEQ